MRKQFLLLCLFLSCLTTAWADSYSYTLSWDNAASHEYHVSLVTQPSAGEWTEFRIPRWRPGRYILQDYAAAASEFQAFDASGKPLEWHKRLRDSWMVRNPGSGTIEVRYKWYANTLDAGSSVLDATQAYFNPSNLFMYVTDRYNVPCTLRVPSMPATWKAGTALHKGSAHNEFTAADYHEFIDSPTFLSPTLRTLHREIDGVQYYFHFQGTFRGDARTETAFLNGAEKIIRAQTAVFGGAPMKEYHFLYQLAPTGIRHAVEHTFSSCYAVPNSSMDTPESVAGIFGITSHEFWHLWNVKRIRPAGLWPYDYKEEQYTGLHWFTEGVTEYYTSLMMVRAGLITEEAFLDEMSTCITDLENSHAGRTISPAQSSEDSWLYTSPYMHPHLRVSYYTHGQRIGFLLDLELRRVSAGQKSLDDVFRYLFQNYWEAGKGVPEDGVQKACESLTGTSFDTFFRNYVLGTEKISYEAFLKPAGLEMQTEEIQDDWLCVGVERMDRVQAGLLAALVEPGSDAEAGGLGDKDLVLEINGEPALRFDIAAWLDKAKKGDVLTLKINRSPAPDTVKITWTGKHKPTVYRIAPAAKAKPAEEAFRKAWLGK